MGGHWRAAWHALKRAAIKCHLEAERRSGARHHLNISLDMKYDIVGEWATALCKYA